MKRQKKKQIPAEENAPLIGVFAPASPIPQRELQTSAVRVAKEGFSIALHPQITHVDGIFAGTDSDRALAFLDYAYDPEIKTLWCGRGGYGTLRLLPLLDEVIEKVGIPPKKTLVGYSDLTVLLDYVATKWGWRAIHGPMMATEQFTRVKGADFKSLMKALHGERLPAMKLKPLTPGKSKQGRIEGKIAGGNLATIASLVGTPYQMDFRGKILFLEEVGEMIYRIDRFLQQLILSGSLEGVRAIVLGSFTDCGDACPQVRGAGTSRVPLRKLIPEKNRLSSLFSPLSEELGIPVFKGLNVGHGVSTGAIEFNVNARISGGQISYI